MFRRSNNYVRRHHNVMTIFILYAHWSSMGRIWGGGWRIWGACMGSCMGVALGGGGGGVENCNFSLESPSLKRRLFDKEMRRL